MSDYLVQTAVVVAAIGCGLNAGLFFAFSTAVMPALGRRPPAEGSAAMQAINITILNPVFGLVFGGTTVLSGLLVVSAPFADQSGSTWHLLGGALFVFGVFGVTVGGNVPLNNALATSDPASEAGIGVWAHYLRRWTALNHLRTVAAAGATTALTLSLT